MRKYSLETLVNREVRKMIKSRTIEKGVPLPINKAWGQWARLADQMKHGDSVVVDCCEDVHRMYAAFYSKGKTCVRRKQSDGTFRVWATDVPIAKRT